MIIIGLDNGFYLRGKTEKGAKFLREVCTFLTEDNYEPVKTYELAYFRKCYNIRRKTIDVLKTLGYKYDECGDCINIKIADMFHIVEDVFKFFLDEENWNIYSLGGSIWNWHITVPSIAEGIKEIRLFLDYLEDDEEVFTEDDFEFYFLDSF